MSEDKFNYKYSSEQQEEIRAIQAKYEKPKLSKMDQLRALDSSVSKKANTYALVIGIIGVLILGCGMSLCMTSLNDALNLSSTAAMIIGTALGLFGIAMVCCAHPIYNWVIKRERKKIAPTILALSKELLEDK